jgi:hypothetical protein
VVDIRLGQNALISDLATFINNGGVVFDVVWELSNGCCGAASDRLNALSIFSQIGLDNTGVTFGNTLTPTKQHGHI